MAQVGWVYLDDFGGRHRIGLYHGDRTGHLLLHCDALIVQVDFSVKETRTYSFFVEDELCEVSVVKEPQGFSYDFQVNKKLDTPRNRLRRSDEQRTRKQMALLITGLVIVVAGVVFGLRWWGRQQKAEQLADTSLTSRLTPEKEQLLAVGGNNAVAQLYVVHEALKRRVFYGFVTANKFQISGYFSVPDTGLIILPNGFPLRDRDAFSVRYLPSDPGMHRVNFEEPDPETIRGYLEHAGGAQAAAHPEATPGHSRCVAQLVLQEKGWPFLADLIFQSVPPERNAQHNRDSYLRLMREPEFAKKVNRACWDR